LFAAGGAILARKITANNCINYFDLIAIFAISDPIEQIGQRRPLPTQCGRDTARRHTAQQAQPSAPKKPLRSAIGSFDVQAPAWS
jgi:hypothetical protein